MIDEYQNGMTLTANLEDAFVAVKARIAAIPARNSLISEISEADWLDTNVVDWMINAGANTGENSDELDSSDEVCVQVA
jgi:hypothetical protein